MVNSKVCRWTLFKQTGFNHILWETSAVLCFLISTHYGSLSARFLGCKTGPIKEQQEMKAGVGTPVLAAPHSWFPSPAPPPPPPYESWTRSLHLLFLERFAPLIRRTRELVWKQPPESGPGGASGALRCLGVEWLRLVLNSSLTSC